MKIIVANLGPLGAAEFEIGDLTIICGCNNTGKTYATYATYGFLDFLRTGFRFPIEPSYVSSLFSKGSVEIDLQSYLDALPGHLRGASQQYSRHLSRVFAGSEKSFAESFVQLELQNDEVPKLRAVDISMGSADRTFLQVRKDANRLQARLILQKSRDDVPSRRLIEDMLSDSVREVLFGGFFPRPFIASAERTGSAIFQKELDFTRNRLVDLLGDKSSKLHPVQFLGKFSGEYPLAVRRNVDFIRDLPSISGKESYLLKRHPEVLAAFADIIGGDYRISKDGEIQYIPTSSPRMKLSLVESSSAVRSLLDIGFYLRHVAQLGDILMVDEPELNLHPENQRRIARLFARLINLGIKVFVTTHSDYIVKELNTLIMLNGKGEKLGAIARREKYQLEELVDARNVRVYMARKGLVLLKGRTRKKMCQTLEKAKVDPKLGIAAETFDSTIEDMNRIQEEIIWEGFENG